MPDPDDARSAAALLVECLAAEGCGYVFSVPGEETMDLLEELAGSIPEVVRKAFRVAQLEKPGPAHIELPENIAAGRVPDALRPVEPTSTYLPEPSEEALAVAARLISSSERPLVLAGNGVLR